MALPPAGLEVTATAAAGWEQFLGGRHTRAILSVRQRGAAVHAMQQKGQRFAHRDRPAFVPA
jgi:hypothetical protein